MKRYDIRVRFDRGYIADPYWPARAKLIDVQKASGVNRARSEANRRKALDEWLRSQNHTFEWFLDLERQANEPFYRNGTGEIIIPTEQVTAFMVCTCHMARAATRPCPPEQVRTMFDFTDWHTGKTEKDGTWERFAVVQAGTGQKLSNQRGLRKSDYIKSFDASGQLEMSDQHVKPAVVQQALKWGGEFVGVGASRKMGWGRFELLEFTEV